MQKCYYIYMNVYLICSESYKKLNDEVSKIVTNSFNVVKYDLKTDSINDVISEIGYYSLTGEHKYIIVRSDNLFKNTKKEDDDNSKVKLDFLHENKEDVTLIFTCLTMPDKRKKIYKEINSIGKTIIIDTLNKKDLTYECMNILKKEGYIIDYDTASFIVDNSYVNYDIMTSEIDKIKVLIKEKRITISSLEGVISESVTDNTFKYINALINRDLSLALSLSKNFDRLKVDPIIIITMLYKEFNVLYLIKCHDKGEVQKLLHKEDWQMNNYYNEERLYSLDEIKKIIIKINDYDFKYKSGLIDKSIILDLIELDLCE